ncbi:unnamed protein product [Angiostrongylus costaricensis]|uniref:Ras-GEF domain-containing protein n=1 Tax=Angiostrongylus costaricensis TaxID=334426 RepID=A0A0R3PHU4_ANGCS|nr:unnamed protein product [Angiostrongylus costaricensis]
MFRGTFYSADIVGVEWMASLRLRQSDDILHYPSRLRDQICVEESEASVRALWAQIVALVLSGLCNLFLEESVSAVAGYSLRNAWDRVHALVSKNVKPLWGQQTTTQLM